MRKTLTITVGCPGSGKSTFADNFKRKAFRIERDRMRECLFGSRQAYFKLRKEKPGLEAVVQDAMHIAMRRALDTKCYDHVLLSDTGLSWRAVRAFHNTARARNMRVEVVYFDVPWPVLLERDDKRPAAHKVGDTVLGRFYAMQKGYPLGDDPAEPQWWLNKLLVDKLIIVDEFGKERK